MRVCKAIFISAGGPEELTGACGLTAVAGTNFTSSEFGGRI